MVNDNPLAVELLDELGELIDIFESSFPPTAAGITQEFYEAYSDNSIDTIKAVFGSFANFKKAYTDYISEPPVTRKSLSIIKEVENPKYPKRYIVSAVIEGGRLNKAFFETLQTVAKDKNAEIVLLPMMAIKNQMLTQKDDNQGFHEDILALLPYFATEYTFNENLVAKDFLLSPQMMLPLTGLSRFSTNRTSMIIAAPKYQMESIPIGCKAIPHVLYTTGACTSAEYTDYRPGEIGRLDHVYGALLVEIRDEKIFHIRHLTADKDNGVYDLDKYYCGDKVLPARAEAFTMGDLHIGFEDPTAIEAWKKCLRKLKPKYVFLHDIANFVTINPHRRDDIFHRINLPAHIQTLEQELNLISDTLNAWTKEFPKITFVVTRGNHDMWLDRFLETLEFAKKEHYHNLKISSLLTHWALCGNNPLQAYVESRYKIKNLIWLGLDDDFTIEGIQCGSHGAKGNNGGKASKGSLVLQYGKANVGHAHSPSIYREVWTAGTSTGAEDYTEGGGSSWLNASVSTYKGGIRQMLISIKGNVFLEK